MSNRRISTYADREILAPRVGQRVNFEITNYIVHGFHQVSKDYGIFKIMALDMQEINNKNCKIGHMLLKLRVPTHLYHYANALLGRNKPVQLSATIKRYRHKPHRHSHQIFKHLEDFQNGKPIGEIEPLHSFGLQDTRIKVPFDLNFELNESKFEIWTDYQGEFATEVRRHIAFEDTLTWLKENLALLGEDDQCKLLQWVQNIKCSDLKSKEIDEANL